MLNNDSRHFDIHEKIASYAVAKIPLIFVTLNHEIPSDISMTQIYRLNYKSDILSSIMLSCIYFSFHKYVTLLFGEFLKGLYIF